MRINSFRGERHRGQREQQKAMRGAKYLQDTEALLFSSRNREKEEHTVECTPEFVERMKNDIKTKKENEIMRNLEEVVLRAVKEALGNKEEARLAIEKEKTRQLEIQLEIAKLGASAPNPIVPEVAATIEFVKEEEEALPTTDAELDEAHKIDAYVIPVTGKGIRWTYTDEFMATMQVVRQAYHDGVNVRKGKDFKSYSKLANGVYQRFMNQNKGIRGAWNSLIDENESLIKVEKEMA